MHYHYYLVKVLALADSCIGISLPVVNCSLYVNPDVSEFLALHQSTLSSFIEATEIARS